MATGISDRWLWVGFGVFFLLAIRGVRYAITDTVRLTELDSEQYTHQQDRGKAPEDSISLETLRTLVSSPNPSIAEAAASLIISRFTLHRRDAAKIIRKDLQAEDECTRRRARQAVKYLEDRDEDLGITIYDLYPPARTNSGHTQADSRALMALLSQRARESHDRLHAELQEQTERQQDSDLDDVDSDYLFETSIARNSELFRRFEDALERYERRNEDGRGIVSRLDELEETAFSPYSSTRSIYRPGTAPYAGWDTIPTQRPVAGEDEREARRRRREATVLGHPQPGFL